jgi:hypothetical protein
VLKGVGLVEGYESFPGLQKLSIWLKIRMQTNVKQKSLISNFTKI